MNVPATKLAGVELGLAPPAVHAPSGCSPTSSLAMVINVMLELHTESAGLATPALGEAITFTTIGALALTQPNTVWLT